MNVKVEIHLSIPDEKYTPEGLGEVAQELADTVTRLGYGNVSAENVDDTILTSLLVMKPADEAESDDDWLVNAVQGGFAVILPTNDKRFYEEAATGNIQQFA